MNRVSVTLLATMLFSAHSAVAADIENGQALYQNNCLICHGPRGHGDGAAAAGLREDPANLYRKLHKRSEAKMIRKVMKGDTDMPAFRGMLSPQDVRDIFAWIRSVNRSETE